MESKPIEFKADTKAFNDGLARANESIGNLHPVADSPNRAHRRAAEARKREAQGWTKARLVREHDKLYRLFQKVATANQAMFAMLLRWDDVAGGITGDHTPPEIGTLYIESHDLITKLQGNAKP